jgi:nucleotide-binding universal stress UspA family protein
MYKHILVSTDGSELADIGVSHGLSLAKSLGAEVVAVTVTEPFPIYGSASAAGWLPDGEIIADYEKSQKVEADKILASVTAAAEKLGVPVKTVYVPNALPAEAILSAAKENGSSLIVMSSHGRRGLNRLLLGSQAAEVLSHSPVPVLIVRQPEA